MQLRETIAVFCIGMGLGGAGVWFWPALAGLGAVVEGYAPEIRSPDGSVVAERDPNAAVKPAPILPAGTKPIRVIKATVIPDDPRCKAVTVTGTIVREKDGAQRVVFQAEGGTIESAVDRPLVPMIPTAPPRRWAAGATYEPSRGLYGGFIERDVWRLRFGVDVQQTRQAGIETRFRIGLAF